MGLRESSVHIKTFIGTFHDLNPVTVSMSHLTRSPALTTELPQGEEDSDGYAHQPLPWGLIQQAGTKDCNGLLPPAAIFGHSLARLHETHLLQLSIKVFPYFASL
ncbi:hypothetical protein FQN60_008041 [Etheostoma spectabile]|uniref:Uncharacterized protein n=1 Tax=Etheostoma spectabile TaxID=54343 RepID=A0A5J5CU91_9PERO|nr:hypothetical protein FQN60_008041 [Etheostoma spectabile]